VERRNDLQSFHGYGKILVKIAYFHTSNQLYFMHELMLSPVAYLECVKGGGPGGLGDGSPPVGPGAKPR